MTTKLLLKKPLNSLLKKVLVTFIIILGTTHLGYSQDLEFKANYIFNIIKYIGWTETQREGDFVIGVVGKTAQANALREVCNGKKFGYQNIVIKEFAKANKISPCQVLFVCDNAFFDLLNEKIIAYGGGGNFLLITEEKGAIDKGSIINFFTENNRVKFEISDENAKALNLNYSSRLAVISDMQE